MFSTSSLNFLQYKGKYKYRDTYLGKILYMFEDVEIIINTGGLQTIILNFNVITLHTIFI